MRIGIDITPITATRVGIGNYCYSVLKAMVGLAPDYEFAGFASGAARVELGALKDRVSHTHFPLPTRGLYALWNVFGRPKVDDLLGGVDVYHATNYFLPPTRTARRVVTIYDLAFLTAPELCSPKIVGVFSSKVGRFVREADAVIACSESTKADAVWLLGAAADRITVAHGAVDADFAPMDRSHAQAVVRRRYGIEAPFLLFVGTLEPRKNLPTLLEAFARVADAVPHALVLAGGPGWNAGPFHETLARLNLGRRVIQTGYIEQRTELAAFYSAADAFLFPSRCEGFGLPLLEAMTCGCPVVTADNSSLPEVAGDAALYSDALDVDAIAANIRRVLEDEALRASLIARGRTQALRFSWERCAATTIDIYRQIV